MPICHAGTVPPARGALLPAGGCMCQVVAYAWGGVERIRPKQHRALEIPMLTLCPKNPTSPRGAWRALELQRGEQRAEALEGLGCQMNRPCHIQCAVEPRPPEAQPNGRRKGKAKARTIPTPGAPQGGALESYMGYDMVPLALILRQE